MPDIEALKTLLPEIEKQEGQWPDDLLGRVYCAMHGCDFKSANTNQDGIVIRGVNSDGQRFVTQIAQRPDTDLTAADKLCGELGYTRISGYSVMENNFFATLISKKIAPGVQELAGHPTSEPLAILAALMKAKIAEGGK